MLLDAAPETVTIGIALAVILFVIAFVVLLAVGLVIFLWYRKRSMRGIEMISPQNLSPASKWSDSTEQSKPTISV